MNKLDYLWYKWRYGRFVADYALDLEKSCLNEDPQDISKIVNQTVPIVTILFKAQGQEDRVYGIYKN